MKIGVSEIHVEKEFRLYPLSDVHYPNHNQKALEKWIKKVKSDPRAIVTLGGDMFDHMRTTARKHIDTFDDDHSIKDPVTQLDELWVNQLAQLLLPIRDKIVGAVGGNHYWQRRDGTISDQNLLKALCIEKKWLGAVGVVFVYVRKNPKAQPQKVTVFLHHSGPGTGGSTRAGDMNVFAKGAERFDADIICLGHTHDMYAVHSRTSKVRFDSPANINVKTPVFVRSGAFQRGFEGVSKDEPMAPYAPTFVENKLFSAPTFGIPYVHAHFDDGTLVFNPGVQQVAA